MALISSVPAIQFTDAGVVLPQESAILAGVQADMNAAFGGGLNPALETPQGQLASSQTAVIGDKNNEIATIINQVDPQYANGRFQDAIARIYFLTRKPATSTVVQCQITGLAGTIIPAGTFARDTSGNTYICDSAVTIPVTGSATAQFSNAVTGPIPCAAGTLTQIYQAIPGWDSITNAAGGVLGSVVESRADFEFRRANSVALNARGTLQAIYAAVFNLPDVLDVYAVENPLGVSVNSGATNVALLPHSLYVAVVGGVDADIGAAIWSKKDVGCDYNGNTTVSVVDTSGYNYPQPTYNVTFNRPTSTPIKFNVQIVNDPALPSDIVAQIQAVVVARFNGADGTTRERIGSRILSSRYYAPIAAISPTVSLIEITLGISTPTLTQITMGIDQSPTITASDVAVTLV